MFWHSRNAWFSFFGWIAANGKKAAKSKLSTYYGVQIFHSYTHTNWDFVGVSTQSLSTMLFLLLFFCRGETVQSIYQWIQLRALTLYISVSYAHFRALISVGARVLTNSFVRIQALITFNDTAELAWERNSHEILYIVDCDFIFYTICTPFEPW